MIFVDIYLLEIPDLKEDSVEVVCDHKIPESVKTSMVFKSITNTGIKLLGANLSNFSCHKLNINEYEFPEYKQAGLQALSEGIASNSRIKGIKIGMYLYSIIYIYIYIALRHFKNSGHILANGLLENNSIEKLTINQVTINHVRSDSDYYKVKEFTYEFIEIFGKSTTLLSLTISNLNILERYIYIF